MDLHSTQETQFFIWDTCAKSQMRYLSLLDMDGILMCK